MNRISVPDINTTLTDRDIMQIKIIGEFTIADIRQALFEELSNVEDKYAVRYSRGATLFINPTNGFGDDVVPRNSVGHRMNKLYSNGPYKSAADDYKL